MKAIKINKGYIDFYSFEYNYFNNRIMAALVIFIIITVIVLITNITDLLNYEVFDD